ncbi:Nse4-domain-containing protein [Conidiobolus coronatus NRRL 28638]|uniref:Non-structural maintenance of chromosomes element 4 n=1 Tax=Conidiobolus coronatus (strain ATCC 28846 / CBS 209.66 / NRRL 28638) TaxID=796925 RepID=A0A137P6H4_CONC2|nr:Nse4-domain-containing protein [Conidiobolus coronatus NRRL 28638]|eukprot:KXN70623.1 Nse4-domain-containing protein [Conidiobolus coronatus NRRL 28638]
MSSTLVREKEQQNTKPRKQLNMSSSTSTEAIQLDNSNSSNSNSKLLSPQETQEFAGVEDNSILTVGGTQLPNLDDLAEDAHVKENNRIIRKRYRQLLTDLEDSQNDLESDSTQSLRDHVLKANELYSQVNSTFEATLDSRVLVMAADMGVKRARKMRGKTKDFNLELFKSCIFNKLGFNNDNDNSDRDNSDDEDNNNDKFMGEGRWDKLNLIASEQVQQVGGIKILMGPLSLQQKVRAVKTQRTTLNNVGQPTTVPKVVDSNDTETENDTTANVIIIANTLAKHSPINLFKFVINPQSYGQTIENIFFLSFLIRDGRAKIEVDKDSHPILTTSQPPSHEDYRKGLIKKQWIFEMDEMMFKGLIKLFGLRKSIIPHRAYETNSNESSTSWD